MIAKKPRKKGKRTAYKEAGAILRAARITHGLSQEDMGKALEMTRQAYAHYELGNALPPAVDLKKLCEMLDLDANVLLGIRRSRKDITEHEEGLRPADGPAAADLQRR